MQYDEIELGRLIEACDALVDAADRKADGSVRVCVQFDPAAWSRFLEAVRRIRIARTTQS